MSKLIGDDPRSKGAFNVYATMVPDILHEFELGVWKSVFTHLIRMLHAEGQESVTIMNGRYVLLMLWRQLCHLCVFLGIEKCRHLVETLFDDL